MGLALGFALFFLVPVLAIFIISFFVAAAGYGVSKNRKTTGIIMMILGVFGMGVSAIPGYFLLEIVFSIITYGG